MRRLKSLSRRLPAALMVILCLGLAGAEYHRFTLMSLAKEKEQTAQALQQQVAGLRQRERKLQPDLPLMERIEATLLDPQQGNLSQQILARVLADLQTAGVRLKTLQAGSRNPRQAAMGHGLTVQFLARNQQDIVAYLRALETGPATARVASLKIGNFNPQNGSGMASADAGQTSLTAMYYSRAK